VGRNLVLAHAVFFDSWQLSIIDSLVDGIGSLPEAKMGPVRGCQKRMDFCGLHTLAFNYAAILAT
jgi:hypothetical protein